MTSEVCPGLSTASASKICHHGEMMDAVTPPMEPPRWAVVMSSEYLAARSLKDTLPEAASSAIRRERAKASSRLSCDRGGVDLHSSGLRLTPGSSTSLW